MLRETAPDNPLRHCRCSACYALRKDVGPALIGLYGKKLLQRGWAGTTTTAEKAYIMAHAAWAQAAARTLAARHKAPDQPRAPFEKKSLNVDTGASVQSAGFIRVAA